MRTLTLLFLLTFILLPSSHAQEVRFFRVVGPAESTITAFSADGYITWTNELTNATFTVQTAQTLVGPSNWVDYVQVPVTNAATTHRLYDPNPPMNMVLIPAGSFTMGNCMDTNEGRTAELPLHTVYVSAFYMDKYEVTKALWDEVKAWNGGNGYSYDYAGFGKAANHPVQSINWFDMVKWCNARSQKEGLTPCYYTDGEQTTIYKTGLLNLTNGCVKWDANGYRLPTEAEWEKAARGGSSGHRFPWSDTDDITHSWANYHSYWSNGVPFYPYDVNSTSGWHPAATAGGFPYTAPVGYWAPNGYGLCDVSGNVMEWCWDWYEADWYNNAGATQNDTKGPTGPSGTRVLRGGSWGDVARNVRCAFRAPSSTLMDGFLGLGFRCVRGL